VIPAHDVGVVSVGELADRLESSAKIATPIGVVILDRAISRRVPSKRCSEM